MMTFSRNPIHRYHYWGFEGALANACYRRRRRMLADHEIGGRGQDPEKGKGFLCAQSHDCNCGHHVLRYWFRNPHDCQPGKGGMEVATRLGCTTLLRTRVFSQEGGDSQWRPCDSAPRHRHFDSVVCLPDEVLVRGRYARAPHGQIWSEILVDVQCCDGEHPIWYASLKALPVDPVRVVGREEGRASRISPWHLAEAVATHPLQSSFPHADHEGRDGPRTHGESGCSPGVRG